jgi:ribose transport system substrate-binding protein
MTRRRPLAAVAVAGIAALATAGFSAGGRQSQQGPDLAHVAKQVAQFKALPKFVSPGPPIDVAKLRGKTMFLIPLGSQIPFNQVIEKTMRGLAKEVGVKYTYFPTQGQPSQWVAGMAQALTQKPDIIVLNTAPDPRLLQPQLAQARKAGIPVVVTHFFDESAKLPPACHKASATCVAGVTANVPAPFNRAAKAEADWIINDSKGKANVLVITSKDAAPTAGIVETMKTEFARYCGSSCTLAFRDVPVSQWQSKTQSEVQSGLINDPKVNYVLPLYDAMTQFAVPGVVASNRVGRVKVVSFNGTAFALKMIEDGNVMAMDVGEDLDWLGYANMDQVFRVLAGMKPTSTEHTPVRIFDKTNVQQAGKPPRDNTGYGSAYVTGYRKLWGLK